MTKKNFFETSDDDSSLKVKSGGSFGLNTGTISKFEFVEKENFTSIDINVKIGEREYFSRHFLNEKVYGNDGLLGPGDEGYEDAFFNKNKQIVAVINHALKALGVSGDDISKVAKELDPDKLFEGTKKLVSLVPSGYQTKDVDIFLQYQYNIKSGQDRTYLELPSNMKDGAFLCIHDDSKNYKEVKGKDLKYVNEAGEEHPFYRSEFYMKGNKTHVQKEGKDNSSEPVISENDAKKSSWN